LLTVAENAVPTNAFEGGRRLRSRLIDSTESPVDNRFKKAEINETIGDGCLGPTSCNEDGGDSKIPTCGRLLDGAVVELASAGAVPRSSVTAASRAPGVTDSRQARNCITDSPAMVTVVSLKGVDDVARLNFAMNSAGVRTFQVEPGFIAMYS